MLQQHHHDSASERWAAVGTYLVWSNFQSQMELSPSRVYFPLWIVSAQPACKSWKEPIHNNLHRRLVIERHRSVINRLFRVSIHCHENRGEDFVALGLLFNFLWRQASAGSVISSSHEPSKDSTILCFSLFETQLQVSGSSFLSSILVLEYLAPDMFMLVVILASKNITLDFYVLELWWRKLSSCDGTVFCTFCDWDLYWCFLLHVGHSEPKTKMRTPW